MTVGNKISRLGKRHVLLLLSDTGMAGGAALRHGQCGLWVVANPWVFSVPALC